jgi:hypothetical protein
MRSIVSTASTEPARQALAAFALLAAAAAVGLCHPYGLLGHLPALCLFHRLTGVDCPGCGMGRATMLLAQGQIGASWQQHPFAILGLAGLALRVGTPATWREQHRDSLQAFLWAGVALLLLRWLVLFPAH